LKVDCSYNWFSFSSCFVCYNKDKYCYFNYIYLDMFIVLDDYCLLLLTDYAG